MIKFFRKIRQRLLSENKFSKYLFYAIGEIVLVMIGILMALQINNWNEHRKLQNTNQILLSKMVGELDLNIDRMIWLDSLANIEGYHFGLKTISLNADIAVAYIDQGLDSTKIEWLLKANLTGGSTLNLHSSVYEEMKNTGRLYTLGSDSLLHKIDKYYRRLEREAYYTDGANKSLSDSWNECKYGFQVFRMRYEKEGISALEDHSWLFDQNSKNYQDLQMFIHATSGTMKLNRWRMKEIIKDSNALKAELTTLLNSKK